MPCCPLAGNHKVAAGFFDYWAPVQDDVILQFSIGVFLVVDVEVNLSELDRRFSRDPKNMDYGGLSEIPWEKPVGQWEGR